MERRIPEAPERRRHANGARAVASVEIAVGDVTSALEQWRQWLELTAVSRRGDDAVVQVGALEVRLYSAAGGRPGAQRVTLAGAGTLSEAVTALRVTTA